MFDYCRMANVKTKKYNLCGIIILLIEPDQNIYSLTVSRVVNWSVSAPEVQNT